MGFAGAQHAAAGGVASEGPCRDGRFAVGVGSLAARRVERYRGRHLGDVCDG